MIKQLTIEEQERLRDLELLKTYLEKELISHGYPKSKAELTVKDVLSSTENLFGYHGLAWELGKKNLEFFCLYFLSNVFIGDDKAEISQTHYEIWDEITNLILGKEITNKKVYICPRGFGKTTFISQSSAIWSALYKYKRFIVLCSAVGDTAEGFLTNIKLALEDNEKIEKAFGKIYDPKHFTSNSEVIELANGVRIKSISSKSVFRGKNKGTIRPELVILDDYQSDDDVLTEEQRNKKWKRFNDDVMKSIQKNTCTLIGCGTLQHKECFYSRLCNEKAWLKRIEKAILIEDIDEYFHSGLWEQFYNILKDNKNEDSLKDAQNFYLANYDEMQYPMLWNEFWDCLEYSLEYYSNPASFKQEYQNDINNIGEKKFKHVATETEVEIESHAFSKTCLVIDPAKTRTKTKTKDYFAFAVISQGSNSQFKYIRKGEIHKFTRDLEYEEYIKHTLFLLQKYKDITHLIIEKQTYGGADSIRLKELISKDDKLCNRDIEIISFSQTQNKDDKINSIVPAVNLGQIIFNEDDIEAIEQLKEFTTCKLTLHDDFVDVVAEASKKIDEIEIKKPGTIYVMDKSQIGWHC